MTRQMDDRPTYRITLTPTADCRQNEAERGLRWILKRAKRQYGLRCVKIETNPETTELQSKT